MADKKTGDRLVDNPLGERIITHFYKLNAIYHAVYGFSASMDFPIGLLFTKLETGGAIKEEIITGFGDLSLMTRYDFAVLYTKRSKLPKIQLGAGLSFPTGKGGSIVTGGQGTNQLALGRGAVNFIAELAFGWFPLPELAIFAQGNLQLPLHENGILTLGVSVLYGGGVSWSFWPERMSIQISFNAEHTAQSIGEFREIVQSSGGLELSLTPAIIWTPTKTLQFSIQGRIPIYQYVNGTQFVSQFILRIGFSYAFPPFVAPR